jgi:hypothetical protein
VFMRESKLGPLWCSPLQIVRDTAHDVANRRREGGGHPRGRSQPAP